MNIYKNQKGITLIALIITIIVMLILVSVTVNVALNGGLFEKAKEAGTKTQKEADREMLLTETLGTIDNSGYLDISGLTISGWTKGTAKQDSNSKTYYEFTSSSGNKFYVYDITGEIVDEEPTGNPNQNSPLITYELDQETGEPDESKQMIFLSTTNNTYNSETINIIIENLEASQLVWTYNESLFEMTGSGTTRTITIKSGSMQQLASATGSTETITVTAPGANTLTYTIILNPWLYYGLTNDIQYDNNYVNSTTNDTIRLNSDGSFYTSVGDSGTALPIEVYAMMCVFNFGEILGDNIYLGFDNETMNGTQFTRIGMGLYYDDNNDQFKFFSGTDISGFSVDQSDLDSSKTALQSYLNTNKDSLPGFLGIFENS